MTNVLADYEAKVREEGLKVFQEFFKDFFEKWPEYKLIAWQQYTPGFRDGDPCFFDVHHSCVSKEPLDKGKELNYWDLWGTEDLDRWRNPRVQKTRNYDGPDTDYRPADGLKGEELALAELTCAIHNNVDILRIAFGASSSVFVTPDEIIVQEYVWVM